MNLQSNLLNYLWEFRLEMGTVCQSCLQHVPQTSLDSNPR